MVGWLAESLEGRGVEPENCSSLAQETLKLFSYFATCKYALPHLRKVKGNIINVSSLVGHIGQPGATTYVSTKGGICAFTRVSQISIFKACKYIQYTIKEHIFDPQ